MDRYTQTAIVRSHQQELYREAALQRLACQAPKPEVAPSRRGAGAWLESRLVGLVHHSRQAHAAARS
jgi:hypothetical protein